MSLASSAAAVDYDATLILAVDTSNKSWVVAAHVTDLGISRQSLTTAQNDRRARDCDRRLSSSRKVLLRLEKRRRLDTHRRDRDGVGTQRMIIPAQGLRIVLAVRPVDFRCGHDALAALVQNTLGLDPHSGLIVVFRSKRRDRLKILLWDGTGIVMIYKRLGDDGGFSWPQISDGVLQLSRVQFEALFDGLNWKRVGEPVMAAPAAAN